MRNALSIVSLLIFAAVASAEFVVTTTPVHPSGVRATVDLPASQHMRNTGGLGRGGPGTGAGLCVFTAIEIDSRWSNIAEMTGFQAWMKKREGGGSPSKVDAMIAAFCKERKIPKPGYVQHTGGDLEFVRLALKTGRCVGTTYSGSDGVFYNSVIAHMVDTVHLDDTLACIVDNNNPGKWLWMSVDEYSERWLGNNGGWGFAFTGPPPPPYTDAVKFDFEQCGPGGCRVPYSPISPGPQGFTWEKHGTDSPWWELSQGGTVLGFYDRTGWHPAGSRPGYFLSEPVGNPPVDPPAEAIVGNNYGIDLSKTIGKEHRYFLNGVEVDRSRVHAALDPALPNDTNKKNLTAVGNPDFLGRVKSAFAKLPAGVNDRLHLQLYTPDNWAVSQFALPAGISLRDAAVDRQGKTLGTIAVGDFTDDLLAAFLDAILNPKPPAPKPNDPAPGPGPANPDPTKPTPWMMLAAIAISGILLLRK